MSLLTDNIQLGVNQTPSQNFVWTTNADGTAKLARGNIGGTTQDILTIGADGNVSFPNLNVNFLNKVLHIQHQTSNGVAGGSVSAGIYNTRPLTTVVSNTITGSSLSINQITLPAGTYQILAEGSLFAGAAIKTRLRNISDGTTTLLGTSDYSNQTSITSVKSTVQGRFTITSTKIFEVQHYTAGTGGGTSALGAAASSGESEVYANVIIQKE